MLTVSVLKSGPQNQHKQTGGRIRTGELSKPCRANVTQGPCQRPEGAAGLLEERVSPDSYLTLLTSRTLFGSLAFSGGDWERWRFIFLGESVLTLAVEEE
jgi:hypothetical protein